jgi:hypothetical protein
LPPEVRIRSEILPKSAVDIRNSVLGVSTVRTRIKEIAVLAEALGSEKSRFRGPARSPFLTCITVVSDGIRERLIAKF